MKGRKVIILITALAAPIAVFLFLKFFGENEFAVEPLFRDALPATTCNFTYQLPYHVPDTVRSALPFDASTAFVVVGFPDGDSTGMATRNFKRLKDAFADDPVAFVTFPTEGNDVLRECVYLLGESFTTATVDREGTIRGQYTLSDLEDADRLSVELKILLRKY